MEKRRAAKNGNGANLGFEEKLWTAADKLRGHMNAPEYEHIAPGPVFLKYISDTFQGLRDRLCEMKVANLGFSPQELL